MRMVSALRYVASAVALSGVALFALASAPKAEGQASFVQDGEAEFVVTYFEYALSHPAAETGACPAGMSQGRRLGDLRAIAAAQPGGRRFGQNDQGPDAERYFGEVLGGNACVNPNEAGPDPNFHSISARNIPAFGIDLDGQISTAGGRAAPGTCAHDDFRGFNGERGIDNQFLRAVGCTDTFQPTDDSLMMIEMMTGAWGVLIRLRGVDDIRNDADVEVGLFANADPIQLSASREALPSASYAMVQDPHYRATTRGRIVNGVLTTDPVDVRFTSTVNALVNDRVLRDARVRMTLSADGVLDGYLAGYTPVEDMYDVQFGYRHGREAGGALAPAYRRMRTALGAGLTGGHSCNGAYHALAAAADGHRDPATGRCTSISTQYRVRAIPAFVVEAATRSLNADLGSQPTGGNQ